MQTISSANSLILFKNNRNKSNIFINNGQNIELILKENYENVFRNIENDLKSNKEYVSFVKLWHKHCNIECKNVFRKIKKLIKEKHNANEPNIDDQINLITYKFRGNLGEIFAEAFFKNGLANEICDGTTYAPVDPNKERYVDADAMSNSTGLQMGIQIKNYNDELVAKKVFDKAGTEDSLRIRTDKFLNKEDKLTYISSPHQIILSFTDALDLFIDTYKDIVVFLGPRYIDSKNLQGNLKLRIPPKIFFFKKIADEIKNF